MRKLVAALCACTLMGCKCSEDPAPSADAATEAVLPEAALKDAGEDVMPDWEYIYGKKIKLVVGAWGTDPWIRITARADDPENWKLPYPYRLETSSGLDCGLFEKSTKYESKPGYCLLMDGRRIVRKVSIKARYTWESGKPVMLRVRLLSGEAEGEGHVEGTPWLEVRGRK